MPYFKKISSFENTILEFKNHKLSKYFENEYLKIIEIPFGETQASKTISDDPKDKKKSIYSIEAILERKIEIVQIIKL